MGVRDVSSPKLFVLELQNATETLRISLPAHEELKRWSEVGMRVCVCECACGWVGVSECACV